MTHALRRLIVNADDFGWDDDTVDATTALMARGWVTSATIMTGRPATARATAFARGAGAGLSFGLHFTIVDGYPAAAGPSSLTDRDGRFHPSHRQRIRALASLTRASDVAAELRAQLTTLLDAGVAVSHVDSHGHLHKFPAVARAMAPVLAAFSIARVRRPQTLYARRSPLNLVDAYCDARLPRGWKTTDAFYAIDPRAKGWLADLPDRLPDGTTEMSVHPGEAETWRRIECAPFLVSAPNALTRRGVTLIDYNRL